MLSDLGPSQSQKLAHEMRFSLILINHIGPWVGGVITHFLPMGRNLLIT